MATKTGPAPDIYQIKVTLLGTKPQIWRRLLVPASLTLAKLHDVLQTAMGWLDCHMHEFHAGERRFGTPDPEDRGMEMPRVENERSIRLSSVLCRPAQLVGELLEKILAAHKAVTNNPRSHISNAHTGPHHRRYATD